MEEEFTTCQGPDCSRKIKQAATGRGHRERLYCSKNCRMAACRARQRAAEAEAERQRLLALELAEKEALRKQFGTLLPASIQLLYDIKHNRLYNQVERIGQALQAERALPTPPESKSLMEANCMVLGNKLGFPAICEQGIDLSADFSAWWHYVNYTHEPVLALLYSIVQRLYREQQQASKVSA
jgi:hypothetical protein